MLMGSTMQLRLTVLAMAMFAVLGSTACSRPTPVNDAAYRSEGQGPKNLGHIAGDDDSLFSFGGHSNSSADASGALGVNAYLWRGALDTLSFMPLASADPFGGVIITDWYQPPSSAGERFKATAYILGKQLRADGVKVTIFRQVLQTGQWVDAPVATTVQADIENKVLARARELRTQSAGL